MFDLPEPLGPTITLTPGENSSLARSGNDLNPFIVIDLRYISSLVLASESLRLAIGSDANRPPPQPPSCFSACSAAACSAAFLLRPSPSPTRSESTTAATSKVRSCGGPDSAITS